MKGLGWFEKMLDDPFRRVTLRGIGFIAFAIGVGGVLHSLLISMPERLKPIEHPTSGVALGTGCDSSFGGGYLLTLRDSTYFCTGADSGCPEVTRVAVTYDENAPEHCRKADRVGRLSFREWFVVLVVAPAGVAIGVGLMLARNRDPVRIRRVFARAALGLGVGLLAAALIWSMAQGGDRLRLGGIWPRRQYSVF